MADPSPLGRLPHRSHVCALVDSAHDTAAFIPPFIRDGLDRGEEVIAVAGGAWLDELRQQLDALNLQTSGFEAAGQLRLVPWTHVVSDPGSRRDIAEALKTVQQFLCTADGQRHAGVRIVEQMDWVVSAFGGSRKVVEYERGVDGLVKTYAQPVVCNYDLSRLSGQLLIQILSTHRVVMIRGAVVESPFYPRPS